MSFLARSDRSADHQHAPAPRPGRLLYVSSAPPVPWKLGPARRNYHVIEQLSRFFDVSILSPGTAADAALAREAFGDRVRHFHFAPNTRSQRQKFAWKARRTLTYACDFPPTHESRLRALCAAVCREQEFDAIVLSCVLLRGLPLRTDLPIVGDTHNVEFDMLRRMAGSADRWVRRAYAALQWRATRREERRCAHGVDLLLTTSERDRRMFEEELAVRHAEVVPNGVDLAEFTLARGPGRPGVILFSGLMSYYPNQQAARWFLDHVFPAVLRRVPTATLVVAGAAPPGWLSARANDRVRVLGHVADMRPYLEEASVLVAPLHIGGGTRVKILEAHAVGRPVVSTSVGAEGLHARDGDTLLIADEPDAFARQVVAVLSDRALAEHLATEGRRHVVRHHDWNRIGERLGALLHDRLALARRDVERTRHVGGGAA